MVLVCSDRRLLQSASQCKESEIVSGIEIKITGPTAMRGGFNRAKLQLQIEQLQTRSQEFLGRIADRQSVSYAQRILEAIVADYGWMDGGVEVKMVGKEPEPVTLRISISFQRREVVDGEWSNWHALNPNDEGEGLQPGQEYQKRISYDDGRTWSEGPILVWEEKTEGSTS